MEARKTPEVVIEGLEVIIERDLNKHIGLLERSKIEKETYHKAIDYQIAKKKHYKSLKNGSKYNKDALQRSIVGINIDITALTNKVKLSQDAIDHHTKIVDTLAVQLLDQRKGLEKLNEYRKQIQDAFRSKLDRKSN